MDLLSFMTVLVRRRRVSLPVFLLGVVLATLSWQSSKPVYETRATVLLRFPVGADQALASKNPYLGYGTLFVPGKVITDVVSSPEYAARMKTLGVAGTYTVGVDTTTQAPIIAISSTAPTSEGSIATSTAVIGELNRVLLDRQTAAGAPAGSLVTSEVVEPPDQPVARNTSRIRASGALLVLGGLLAVAAALVAEALGRRHEGGVPVTRSDQRDLPCSICAGWFPEDQLLLHLEVQHGLVRPGLPLAPVEHLDPPGAARTAPAASPAHAHAEPWPAVHRSR
ncbi:MAG: hypothetical protein JWN88_1095 [Frankiales bacterium]|nr:hypothetical protein [Frankiales bacterium]